MNFRTLSIAVLLFSAALAVTSGAAGAQTEKSPSAKAISETPVMEKLNTIPDSSVISSALGPVIAQLRYADDKMVVLATIAALDDHVRYLFWLTYLLDEASPDQMHTFFTKEAETETLIADTRKLLIESGQTAGQADAGLAELRAMNNKANPIVHVEAVAGALGQAGLLRQLEAFRAAQALAAKNPDADFAGIDVAFGSRDDLREMIGAYAARTPSILEWLAEARNRLSDEDRFLYLAGQLDQLEESDFENLPKAYRQIHVVDVFNAEMLNGSVHQFFYNSSGRYASDIVAAMRNIGLSKHADAVQRGIDMFRSPYPTDTAQRRAIYFNGEWSNWDEELADLTGDVDDGEITPPLIALAKQESILPR